ncbi:unnamed protein product [Durusdinium trenchii]|uniref:Uncharacterized protein n=1 Tax=Durusdinium trenchii TaxID=1381693 RepID=A0ABP0KX14_9DINO|eukprot:g31794.t1
MNTASASSRDGPSAELPRCAWSRQHSYASTAASSQADEVEGAGSDEHPAFAMLSGDEHPSAYEVFDDQNETWEVDLLHCAIDVLQRAVAGGADSDWRAMLDFELFPLCDQSRTLQRLLAHVLPTEGVDFEVKREELPRLLQLLRLEV